MYNEECMRTLCIVDCVCTMYIAECMCTMHNEECMCTMYIMRSVRVGITFASVCVLRT